MSQTPWEQEVDPELRRRARALMLQEFWPLPPPPTPQANATVNVQRDSLIAIAVGGVCIWLVTMTCTVCIAAVVVVAVMRSADVRDMSQIRGRLTSVEQFGTVHERRLNELEKRNDE